MSIYQRIGEAIASQGKITLVAALTPNDETVLKASGFKKVGTMDLNGTHIDLYEVKVTQIVNAPYTGIRAPIGDSAPYTKPNKFDQYWPENYHMYTNGTGTAPSVQYRGSTTSLMDTDYNPLSILEDYFFPEKKRIFKIDISDLNVDEKNKFCDEIKNDYTQKSYNNDSWTSYNQGYTGNRDFRNW